MDYEALAAVLKAAAMFSNIYTLGEMYMLYTAISKDPIVQQRCLKLEAEAGKPASLVPDGATLTVVNGMTELEKDELRTRIQKRWLGKVSPAGQPAGVRVLG